METDEDDADYDANLAALNARGGGSARGGGRGAARALTRGGARAV